MSIKVRSGWTFVSNFGMIMMMTHRSAHIRKAGFRPVGRTSAQRMTGSLALLAILAMVLASPIHLMLAHGHDHNHDHGNVHGPHEVTTVEMPVFAGGCQHHHHHQCDVHGPAPAQPAEDCNHTDTDPCQDHAGECETCMVLATLTPVDIGFETVVGDRDFLEFAPAAEECLHISWRGHSITTRGPPARA